MADEEGGLAGMGWGGVASRVWKLSWGMRGRRLSCVGFRVARSSLRVFFLKANSASNHLALRAKDFFRAILSMRDGYCGRLGWL